MTTEVKKFQNEIHFIEDESDKFIEVEKYYIIKITSYSKQVPFLFSYAKEVLTSKYKPDSTYLFSTADMTELLLIFHSQDQPTSYFFHGSYSSHISYYTSVVSAGSYCPDIYTRILEFDSQIKLITYLILKVHNNTKICISKLSEGQLELKILDNLTFQESIEKLKIHCTIDWNDVANPSKYGILYKLKKVKNELKIISLSEYLDARKVDDYKNFIFS